MHKNRTTFLKSYRNTLRKVLIIYIYGRRTSAPSPMRKFTDLFFKRITLAVILSIICFTYVVILYDNESLVANEEGTSTSPGGSGNGGSEGGGAPAAGAWNKGASPDDELKRRLPGCIIIGVRKCGTRALIDMLNLHPQVEKSPLEIHFFDRDENYIRGLDWYAEQFPPTTRSQIAIEKSPSYFVTPEVPERIYEMNSSVKLLLIVREPVTRIISDYTQIYLQPNSSSAASNQQQPTLEELALTPSGAINTNYKAIRISMYSRYMRRWLDVFAREQIHVIDGDALIRDPYHVLRDVEKFLNLEHKLERDYFYFNNTKGFYCWRGSNRLIHCLNDSKGRRHPVVKVGLVRRLREFYRGINYEFYEMVGRDFGWPES